VARELTLQAIASFTKSGVTFAKNFSGILDITGKYAVDALQNIGVTDELLAEPNDLTAIGYVILRNNAAKVVITRPFAPVITVVGTPGASTWSYVIVAKQADGTYSQASPVGTTLLGNTTLNGTNYNHIVWPAVLGATSYDIYRTAHGSSPSTNGFIGSTDQTSFDDQGGAGDGATAPAVAADNMVLLGTDGTNYPLKISPGNFMIAEWNAGVVHAKANTVPADVEFMLLPR
jgi:hypothetical protein